MQQVTSGSWVGLSPDASIRQVLDWLPAGCATCHSILLREYAAGGFWLLPALNFRGSAAVPSAMVQQESFFFVFILPALLLAAAWLASHQPVLD